MDHGFSRHTEPWERTDGCVCLLKALSKVKFEGDASVEKKAHDLVCKHMETLSDMGFIDHFKHAAQLKEHLFQTLAVFPTTEGLGKRKYRGYVEFTLDSCFRNTNHETQLCAVAAQDYLLRLNKIYGEKITFALIENHNPKYVQEFQTIKAANTSSQNEFNYPAFGQNMIPGGHPGSRIGAPGAVGGGFPVAKAPWAK